MNRSELIENINEYNDMIADCEKTIRELDGSQDVFHRMRIIEAKSDIREYNERIARLNRRIAGTEETGPTDEQLRLMEYVLSDAYDNE